MPTNKTTATQNILLAQENRSDLITLGYENTLDININ